MKEIVTQSSFVETINGMTYVTYVQKAGDQFNVSLRMDTTFKDYDKIRDFLEGTFEKLKLKYCKEEVIKEEPAVIEEPKKRGWPKGKPRTGQQQVHKGWPKGKPRGPKKAIATKEDLANKSKVKKLSEFDPFTFVKNIVDKETDLREDNFIN